MMAPAAPPTRRAVFLDRDGTINVKAPEGDYITTPAQVRLLPGAAAAIRQANAQGALVIVVTNQRGVSLGRMTAADVQAVHDRLTELLAREAGATIDAFFVCPHDEGACDCRKPQPGLLHQALRRFPEIDVTRSALIGDTAADVAAGTAVSVRSLQLGVDAADLAEAMPQALDEPVAEPAESG